MGKRTIPDQRRKQNPANAHGKPPGNELFSFFSLSTAGNRSRTTPRRTGLPAAASRPRAPKAGICAGYGPPRHPGAGDTLSPPLAPRQHLHETAGELKHLQRRGFGTALPPFIRVCLLLTILPYTVRILPSRPCLGVLCKFEGFQETRRSEKVGRVWHTFCTPVFDRLVMLDFPVKDLGVASFAKEERPAILRINHIQILPSSNFRRTITPRAYQLNTDATSSHEPVAVTIRNAGRACKGDTRPYRKGSN